MTRNFRLLVRASIAAALILSACIHAAGGRRPGLPATIYERWTQDARVHYGSIVVEASLGLWMLSGRGVRGAAVTVLVLLSILSGLIYVELGRDRPQPCGCFGVPAVEDPGTVRRALAWSLVRNVAMIGGAACLWTRHSPRSRTI